MHRSKKLACIGILLGTVLSLSQEVIFANADYHNGGVDGAPNVGNWSWTNRSNGKHIWWVKHHWTSQTDLNEIEDDDLFEMEMFDGGKKRMCDRFNITSVVLQQDDGNAHLAFRAEKPHNECGDPSILEEVEIRVIDKSKIPLASSSNNRGPAWAALADGKPDFPEPCPPPNPGSESCSELQTNLEWEHSSSSQLWLGKIHLGFCVGSQYRATGSDRAGLLSGTTTCQ